MMEQWPMQKPPESIEITPDPELKTNAQGHQYLEEENGVYYGGDYLPKPPQGIDTDFPEPPPHENPLAH